MDAIDGQVTPELIAFLAEFVRRSDVNSVSMPVDDEAIWSVLVTEQKRRASLTGKHLQHAFGLSGPDSGLSFNTADWGGYVHIPWEGMCGADLVMRPHWRVFDPRGVMSTGTRKFWDILRLPCHHVMVWGDRHPPIDTASRMTVGGWTFYTSRGTYRSYNPFRDRKYDPDEPLPEPWAEPI